MSPGSDESRGAVGTWVHRTKLVVILVAVVLVVIVLFQNLEPTTFDVLFWQPEMPRAVLIVASFVVGALAGALTAHLAARR